MGVTNNSVALCEDPKQHPTKSAYLDGKERVGTVSSMRMEFGARE